MSNPFCYFNSSPEIIRLALIVPTRREDGIGPASAIGVRTRDGRRLSRELVPPQPGSASPPVAKPTGRDRSRPSSGMAADARARLSDPGRGIANLVMAHADSARARDALKSVDFMVHADLFMCPTAELAEIVLPVASAFETE